LPTFCRQKPEKAQALRTTVDIYIICYIVEA
jgi:hypothetical protein